MTIEAQLRALAGGEPAHADLLLQTARAHAFGISLYGREDIAQAFRRQPIAGEAQWIASDGQAALLWEDHALIADIAGAHVARLWRIGPDAPLAREPTVAVPFDPDLAQVAYGEPIVADGGIPLRNVHDDRLAVAARRLAVEWRDAEGEPAARVRPFRLRVLGNDVDHIGLFAVHVLQGSGQRAAGYIHVAIAVGVSGARTIRDRADETLLHTGAPQPRLR